MNFFRLALFGLVSGSAIQKRWDCPSVIPECTQRYNVQPNEWCSTVANNHGLALDVFYAMNPSLGGSCGYLYAGCDYCVSKSTVVNPTCPTDYNSQCSAFYEVKPNDWCNYIVAQANDEDLDLARLYELNPSIHNPQCDNLKPNCKYCTHAPDPPGYCYVTLWNTPCDKTFKVKTGYTCDTVIQKNPGLTLEEFKKLNIIDSCDRLHPRCNYCVHSPSSTTGPPDPHQPNIKKDCKEYYGPAKSGDNCWQICQDKGVVLSDFLSWNPDVGPDCRSMMIGYYYCLRI